MGLPSLRLTPICVLWIGCAGTSAAPPSSDAWRAPDNAWPVSAPPADLTPEGFLPGEVLPDVRLADQHGDVVSTWQFYDEVVLVTVGAVWCAPCRALAEQSAAWDEAWGAQGFVHLTVLAEDASGLTPEVTDAAAWAEAYGDHAPVVVDPDSAFGPWLAGQFPIAALVSRDLRIQRILPGASDDLASLIEAEL